MVCMPQTMDVSKLRRSSLRDVLRTAVLVALVALTAGCGGEPPPLPLEKPPWLIPMEQIKLLTHDDARIRKLAAKNLGRIGAGAAEAIPELENLRDDEDPKVSKAAVEAIEKIRAAIAG
jgi:hypothetical protein